MSEAAQACWICLGERTPNAPGDRYHKACIEALFGVPEMPTIAFDRFAVTMWAEEHAGRLSISGFQPKGPAALDDQGRALVLVEKDSTFIVKPPHPQFLHTAENEHLTMCLARLVGIDVAEHGLVTLSDGAVAYITKRFDRPAGSKGPRVHVVDYCQLAEKDPEDKEDSSAEECAELTRRYAGPDDSVALFQRLVFADWVRNGDLHLKNLMLMEKEDGGYTLTPAYDLLCTAFYGSNGIMLPVGGERVNVTRKLWLAFGETYCGIDRSRAAAVIDAMLDKMPEARELIQRCAFPHEEWKRKYTHWLEKRTRHLSGKV